MKASSLKTSRNMKPTTTTLKILTALFVAVATITPMIQAQQNFVQLKDEQIDSLEHLFNKQAQAYVEDRLYLSTNQPIYSPGENIWFSVFVRDAQLKKSNKSEIVHVELKTPSGKIAQQLNLIARNGQAGGDFITSNTMPGGYYKIRAYTDWMLNESDSAGYTKEVLLQKVILPRLKMNLTFDKTSYSKGDEVIAKFSANTNENKPLRNKSFTYELKVDGLKFKEGTSTTGDDGVMYVRYNLPVKMKTRDVQMNVKLDYDGVTEGLNKQISISSNNISLQFYPEGGDLILNTPSRVAFKASDEDGNPVSVDGVIKDTKGHVITEFKTYHKGMGLFHFTPAQGESYYAFIKKPSDVSETWNLPKPLTYGYTMEVNTAGDELLLNIHSTGIFKANIIIQIRGQIYFSASRLLSEGDNEVRISTANFPAGVAQITLLDQQLIPRTERLVFVNRDRQLSVSIETERDQYQSRDKVKATLRTTDASGNPVPAYVLVNVVNDQLVNYADDKSSNILSAMLLEYDLKEKVEDPNFYFDLNESKSLSALDLLMMTSGWRRFSWKQILTQQTPTLTHEGEIASFTILVIDGVTGKPLPHAHLKLKQSGSLFATDNVGKALFTNIDLYEPVALTVSASNYNSEEITISKYATTNTVWLYPTNYIYPDLMMDAAPIQIKGDQIQQQNAEIIMPAPKDIEQVKRRTKPQEDQLKKKEEQDHQELIVDKRINTIFKMDTTIQKQNQTVTYYRTRIFPQKKYAPNISDVRSDFNPTLYFNHALETDINGKVSFEFTTNDLITSFRIIAEGIASSGLIGRQEKLIFTQLPITIQSKLPGTLTSGDLFSLPVIVKNNSSKTITGTVSVRYNVEVFASENKDTTITLPAQTTYVLYRKLKALPVQALDTIQLTFNGTDYSDATTVPVSVDLRGFPVQQSFSGRDLEKSFSFKIKDALPGTVKVTVTAYPSTVSTILKGVSGLLRRPSGCFEQTSMSSYPNAMIMDYLRNSQNGDEKTYAQAKQLLAEGYARLVTFETKQKGYEWFGSAPGHEALTAYGLMQFNEYKMLYKDVDEEMIKRTSDWLLARRNGKGGYQRNPNALDNFGRANEEVTNLYITYALSEAGYSDLAQEIEYSYQTALTSSDPYLLALAANTLLNAKDKARADKLMVKLYATQNAEGALKGAKQSITCSSGIGLDVETTSLGVLAMMRTTYPDYVKIEKSVDYLLNMRNAYGDWGNTQATILALKTISKYSLFSKRTAESGTIIVFIGDKQIGEASFRAGETEPIELSGLEQFIEEGNHNLKIKYKGVKVALPYSVNITYNVARPPSSDACDLSLHTTINTTQCRVGDIVRMTITVQNKRNDAKPFSTAVIGIPAGLSIQASQLKALQTQNRLAYFEIWDNNLVLYFRQIKSNEEIEIPVDLKAEIPGQFEAAASNVFLYYTTEYKDWVMGEKINITK